MKEDKTLFDYKWDFTHFTDESVDQQNHEWELKYNDILSSVLKLNNAVNFELTH